MESLIYSPINSLKTPYKITQNLSTVSSKATQPQYVGEYSFKKILNDTKSLWLMGRKNYKGKLFGSYSFSRSRNHYKGVLFGSYSLSKCRHLYAGKLFSTYSVQSCLKAYAGKLRINEALDVLKAGLTSKKRSEKLIIKMIFHTLLLASFFTLLETGSLTANVKAEPVEQKKVTWLAD